MVRFEAATDELKEHYGEEFDRIMHFDHKESMRVIQLAAKARIGLLKDYPIETAEINEGILSLNPLTDSVMMNRPFAAQYSLMLASYAQMGFLYADVAEGVDIDDLRQQASALADDIAYQTVAFDVGLSPVNPITLE
jgi:hypothetical protein